MTRRGFPYDRHFILLKIHKNENGTESLQRMQLSRFPEMCLFLTNIVFPTEDEAGKIIVTYQPPGIEDNYDPCVKTLEVPLQPSVENLKKVNINLHSSPTEGYDMGSHYNDWFSSCFGYSVVLIYLGGNSRRVLGSFAPSLSLAHRERSQSLLASMRLLIILLSMTFIFVWVGNCGLFHDTTKMLLSSLGGLVVLSASFLVWQFKLIPFIPWGTAQDEEERITFSDSAAYLVVSETSLHNVSARLAGDEEMDITKFRPNVVVQGADAAFEEDFWAELAIGKSRIRLLLTANCLRCQSINVDFATGKFGTGDSGSVLKKLMKDRRVDKGAKYTPVFGRYSFISRDSDNEPIRVGDEVALSRTAPERTVFGGFP